MWGRLSSNAKVLTGKAESDVRTHRKHFGEDPFGEIRHERDVSGKVYVQGLCATDVHGRSDPLSVGRHKSPYCLLSLALSGCHKGKVHFQTRSPARELHEPRLITAAFNDLNDEGTLIG